MKTRLTLGFTLLLICAGTDTLLAQSYHRKLIPETICHLEVGAASGLCHSYCESMDCDSEASSDLGPACEEVRTKFQNVAGHDVPCELPCPCQTIPEFNAILEGANFCFDLLQATFLHVQPLGSIIEYAASSTPIMPNPWCYYGSNVTDAFIFLPITHEQAKSCVDLLQETAASRGVMCGPLPR